MKPIFARSLLNKRLSIICYCLAGIGLLWLYIAMFPSLQAQMQTITDIRKAVPQGIIKAFGIEDLSITSLAGFLAVEQFSFTWPLIALFYAVSLASSLIAGEVELGSIGLLLAAPVSRTKIYWSKYLAGLVAVVVFVLSSIAAIIPIAALSGLHIQWSHVGVTTLVGGLFCWAVFSLAMMASSAFSEKAKVSVSLAGLLLAMYVAKLVASLINGWSWLRYSSFFYYFDPTKALKYGQINGFGSLVFVGTIVIGSLLGLIIFGRRDVVV